MVCPPCTHKVDWGGGGVVASGNLTTGEGMLRFDRHVSGRDGDGGGDSTSLVPGVEKPPTEPDKDVDLGGHGGADPESLASAAETTSTQPAVDVDGCATRGTPLVTAPWRWSTPKKSPLTSFVAAPALMMPALSIDMPPRVAAGPSDASSEWAAGAGDEGRTPATLDDEPASMNERLAAPSALPPDRSSRLAAAVAPAASN